MLFWLETLPGCIRVVVGDVSTNKDDDKFAAGVYEIGLELLDSGNWKGLDVFWIDELVKLVTTVGKEEIDGGGGIMIWLGKF